MNQNFELIVHEDWSGMFVSFYLKKYEGSTRVIIGQKDGELIEQRTKDVVAPSPLIPLLKMPTDLANIFLKSVGDYNSGKGNITVNENLLKGKLESTEKHLEDMRTMSKLMLDRIIKIK